MSETLQLVIAAAVLGAIWYYHAPPKPAPMLVQLPGATEPRPCASGEFTELPHKDGGTLAVCWHKGKPTADWSIRILGGRS